MRVQVIRVGMVQNMAAIVSRRGSQAVALQRPPALPCPPQTRFQRSAR